MANFSNTVCTCALCIFKQTSYDGFFLVFITASSHNRTRSGESKGKTDKLHKVIQSHRRKEIIEF